MTMKTMAVRVYGLAAKAGSPCAAQMEKIMDNSERARGI